MSSASVALLPTPQKVIGVDVVFKAFWDELLGISVILGVGLNCGRSPSLEIDTRKTV